MPEHDLSLLFIRPLNRLGIRYGRDELDAMAFRNSRKMDYQGEPVTVAPPEIVIIRKLEYYREGGSEKHLRDIRAMLAVSGEMISHTELNDWIEKRHLQAEWQKASQTKS